MAPFTRPQAPMSRQQLHALVENGHVDTVIVATADMQGRLQGKRVHARYFIDEIATRGLDVCSTILATDVDLGPADGYTLAGWGSGFGDVVLRPDHTTLRAAPWLPASVFVLADVEAGGSAVPVSPREILKQQVQRATGLGFGVLAQYDLQFRIFDDSYESAWNSGYAGLTPANQYPVNYSVLGTSRVEPVLRDIRNALYASGLTVEAASGETAPGQHLITFHPVEVLTAADHHAIYKTAVKEIAARHGKAATFMAQFDETSGSSCHLGMALRGLEESEIVFGQDGPPGLHSVDRSETFDCFLAGVLSTLREFSLLYAPNINSYKRFRTNTFAPTTVTWGVDNRTCALRVVGSGGTLRVENRVPGADVNGYLGFAAMLAGGLHGIENHWTLEPAYEGNAHDDQQHLGLPTTLREARDLFEKSDLARMVFGDDVVAHYVNAADLELAAYDSAVTDWERRRGFERL